MTEASSVEFIGYQMLQHKQNGCTFSFTRHHSNKSVSGFFYIMIGCVDIGI